MTSWVYLRVQCNDDSLNDDDVESNEWLLINIDLYVNVYDFYIRVALGDKFDYKQ